MKSLVGKLGMLTLLAAAVGVGCSSSQTPTQNTGSEGPTGSVGLKLQPVSGVTLNSIHYVVQNGATPAATIGEGDLPTPGTAKDFSFGLSLPVGTGDTISLTAASVEDPLTICSGSFGPFNVTPNAPTNFTLTLTCTNTRDGQLIGVVDVKTDLCPRLVFDYVVATPASANIPATGKPITESQIAVAGKAHDLDGKAVTYSWKLATPAVGTFAPLTGATSTLTCATQGLGTLLTVTASNGECTKALNTTISCKSLLCGNAVVDPGETCDIALPGPCPADCNSVCGDGIAEAPVETCDPPNGTTCDTTCHIVPPRCGDNLINQVDEVCDGTAFPNGTAPGSTCSTDCHTITPPQPIVCGDGMVSGTEQCDAAGPSPICSTTCGLVSTQACVDCENAGDCFESVDNCANPAFSAAQKAQCFAVMTCIEQKNCLDGTGSLGACYCGTLSTSDCSAAPFTGPGSPNGLCKAEIQAGMTGVTTNAAVLGGLTAAARPAGAAMARLNCQKIANNSACLAPCGLTAGGPVFP